MAKFKYLGEEMLVGRFGRLKKGAIVDLWQSEADYVTNHDQRNWKDVSKADNEGVGTVVPIKVPPYDLTRINWLLEARGSLKRMSRGELGDVASAMRLVGCKLPSEPEARNFSREHLFEVLFEEVRRLLWDQPTFKPVEDAPDAEPEAEDEPETPTDGEEAKPVRAHNEDGTFKADDPATPEVNEAYEPPTKVAKKASKRIVRKRN